MSVFTELGMIDGSKVPEFSIDNTQFKFIGKKISIDI